MNWRYTLFLWGLMVLFVTSASAQYNPSSRSRTDPFAQGTGNDLDLPEEEEEVVEVKKKPTIDTTYFKHSPSKAMVLSAVIPGLGQAYNKKFWKIPIVYGALGGCVYWFCYSNSTFLDYRDGYISFMDKDPTTNFYKTMDLRGLDDYGNVTDASLVERELSTYKDAFDRNRSMALLSIVLVYALNIIDASVDAHLFNFDVSEDISMRVDPVIIPAKINSPNQYGLAWKIKF